MLDAVAQRQLAAAAFIGICAFKTHNIYFHYIGSEYLTDAQLGIWCLVDAIFFLCLWRARIPRLDFRFLVYALITFAVCMINTGLAAGLASRSHSADDHLHLGRHPSTDYRTPFQSDIFNETHILGSHLVNVLPPTLSKFNATSFCLGFSETTVNIPLKVKGTPPYTIAYEYYGFDGAYHLYDNVTLDGTTSLSHKHEIKKERRIDIFPIPANKPGIYRLVSVQEEIGEPGRILQDNIAEVVTCPDASIQIPKEDSGKEFIDRCIDESYPFSIAMSGTPPFSGWYLGKIGKRESLIMVEAEVDLGTGSPLPKSRHTVPDEIRERLIAARPREAVVPVEVKVDAPSEFLYKLVQVTDGHNNTVRYPSGFEHEQPPSAKPPIQADRYGESFLIKGRPLPSARFEQCESIKIRTAYKDEAAEIPVVFDGSGPYSLRYALAATEEDAAAGQYLEKYHIKRIEQSRITLPVQRTGVYVLLSASDRYCPGNVELPSTCVVQEALPPSLSITVEPIVNKCAGATGVNVNLSMTGEPPFMVEYDQIEKATAQVRHYKKQSTKALQSITFEPREPGEYEYIFKTIGDAVYREGVPVADQTFTQVVHPLPDVQVTKQVKKTRCLGDTAHIGLHITGVPPYSLQYEIMKGTTKERLVKSNITKREVVIETPPLSSPGTYFVDFVEITDGNGCATGLTSRPISIEVLSQRPSVHFQCPKPVHLLEGSNARIPVGVSGHGQYVLRYKNLEDGKEGSVSGAKAIEAIEVTKPGRYELVGFEDAYCTGRVLEPSSCQVVTIPKPTLTVPESEYESVEDGILQRKAICEGAPDRLDVRLSGKPPFKIPYQHEVFAVDVGRTSKEKEISEYEERTSQQFARINLFTDKAGLHTYTFPSVSDDNYRKQVRVQDRGSLKLQQLVYTRPRALFLDPPERIFQCISKETDTELRIQLTGTPPFRIQLHRKPESQPREVIYLESNTTSFIYRPEKPAATGRYTYTIKSVTDASGCETILDGHEQGARVTVQVADMARITMDHPQKLVCVGDQVEYSLEGTAPFTIGYEWNGVRKPDVTVTDPVLVLFAAESGFINVTRVCNAMGCCSEPPGGLGKDIKALPKAIVDGGVDMIDDIREGDESVIGVEFHGTPPFSFRYTRTPLMDRDRRRESEESFTVEGVQESSYILSTDKEGLFRVTWVRDRFCEYPPKKMADPKIANAILKGKGVEKGKSGWL